MHFLLLMLYLAFGVGTALCAEPDNGFWWLKQPESTKLGYIHGFIKGGHKAGFLYKAILKSPKTESTTHPSLFTMQLEVVDDMNDFTGARFGQFESGLDDFYKDFKNMSVHVDDALPYVRDQIRGTRSDKDLAEDLQRMRRLASGPGYDD